MASLGPLVIGVIVAMLGPVEIGLVVVVIVLLFGATRLPQLGRSMGESIRGFKKGLEEDEDEAKKKTVKKDDNPQS